MTDEKPPRLTVSEVARTLLTERGRAQVRDEVTLHRLSNGQVQPTVRAVGRDGETLEETATRAALVFDGLASRYAPIEKPAPADDIVVIKGSDLVPDSPTGARLTDDYVWITRGGRKMKVKRKKEGQQ